MNDTIIFQHVLSNSPCCEWLALTTPITLQYCLKHHMDYHCIVGTMNEMPGHWDVPLLIKSFMDLKYTNVIYLDADTVIVDSNVDMREAIVTDKIGAVWHDMVRTEGDLSHFNVGALYVANTAKVRYFVDLWIAKKPGNSMNKFPLTFEQGVFNTFGTEMIIIHKLDNKWNAEIGISPSDHAVVQGFHGFPNQLEAIRNSVEGVEKATVKI